MCKILIKWIKMWSLNGEKGESGSCSAPVHPFAIAWYALFSCVFSNRKLIMNCMTQWWTFHTSKDKMLLPMPDTNWIKKVINFWGFFLGLLTNLSCEMVINHVALELEPPNPPRSQVFLGSFGDFHDDQGVKGTKPAPVLRGQACNALSSLPYPFYTHST